MTTQKSIKQIKITFIVGSYPLTLFQIPPIDKDADGVILQNFQGNIRFENVSFVYPTRPEVAVSLSVAAHQKFCYIYTLD